MIIQTPRLLLRPFEAEDLDDFYSYCSQSGVGEMAGWPAHTSKEQSAAVLQHYLGNPDYIAIYHRREEKVIGNIVLRPDEEGGENSRFISFVLNRDYHRRGFMTEAVGATVMQLAIAGITRIRARCFQHNIASKGLLEKCNFAYIGEGHIHSPWLQQDFDTYEFVFEIEE